MSRSGRPLLPFLLLALLPACATTPAAPTGPRLVAEWEPARATMVVFPFELPDALVTDLARVAPLVVLVRDEERDEAVTALAGLSVDEARYRLVSTRARSPWTRDWGPHQVVTADGRLALVDHVFLGYPWVPAESEPADYVYRWPMRGEDDAVLDLAAEFGLDTVALPAIATGGNLLHDGHGRAFCTEAQLVENLAQPAQVRPPRRRGGEGADEQEPPPPFEPPIPAPIDEAAYRALLREHLGVTDLVVLENTEPFGIQHIDCWLKVVDEETLLVKRAPVGHPEHDPIERNVERLRALRTPSGGTYRIVRIECEPYEEDRLPAYTNSLLVNGVVHVPLFGGPSDEAALATYRAVYPDAEVRGYPFEGWQHFDALHCRARALQYGVRPRCVDGPTKGAAHDPAVDRRGRV